MQNISIVLNSRLIYDYFMCAKVPMYGMRKHIVSSSSQNWKNTPKYQCQPLAGCAITFLRVKASIFIFLECEMCRKVKKELRNQIDTRNSKDNIKKGKGKKKKNPIFP